MEIENAVRDLIILIVAYPLDAHIEPVTQAAVDRLKVRFFVGLIKPCVNFESAFIFCSLLCYVI